MMTYDKAKYLYELKGCLKEDLEWAEANEWEVPLSVIIDLKETISFIDEVILKGMMVEPLSIKEA